uniref:centromere protein J-like n=1 Tax=Pristiophorus japonicus TaxID=55135 RepID=UPI00398EE012
MEVRMSLGWMVAVAFSMVFIDESIPEDENCPGNLSPIKEEKGEQGAEQRAVTPFGIKRNSKKTGGLEERPIRPGIGEKQKTFEDFVEELLKVDSELFQQDPQDINEVTVAPKKSFLKRGEGIARFEKSKENVLKEQNTSLVCESTKQFPGKVSFSNQRRLSLPILNESETLQIKKQATLKKQVSSTVLVASKAKKSVSTGNSLTNGKKKDQMQKEKLDEIKNSTDEGIQSDINVAELVTKVEWTHKYSDDRKDGCQQQENETRDLITLEESQGRPTVSRGLSLHIPESQQFIGVNSQLQNQSSSSCSQQGMERQNRGQQIGQNMPNQLLGPSNVQPCFSNTSHLECFSTNRTEAVNQGTEMVQQQAEKDHKEDAANVRDSRKLLDRKGPSIGFKKINDRIVQVTPDGLPCRSTNFRNQDFKTHDMHSVISTGLAVLSSNDHSMDAVLKNNNAHRGEPDTKANSTDTEDDGPKSECHEQPIEIILQNSGQIDKNLDLSDDADYASDAPSGTEEMNATFQTSQHSVHYRSIAGVSLVKHNALSSTSSSENEPLDLKSNTLSRRFPFPYNRPMRNKNKAMRRKSNFAKKSASSFVKNQTCDTTEPNLEQTSTPDLTLQLLPALNSKPKVSINSDLPEQVKTSSVNIQDDAQSRQLQGKLLQLETEIDRFKAENIALGKLKEKHELAMENLKKRMDQFEHEKTEEIAQLEEYKKEEMKKLQKERRLSEKNSAAKAALDKKEHEEMELLKWQLGQLQEDFRKNESRWSLAHNCLRKQIDTLTKENVELRDELKTVECHRQGPVKKTETTISRKFETPVSDAIIKGTSQTASWSHRSRSSTPTGRRMPLERRQTPVDPELKVTKKVEKRPETQKTEMQEIHDRSPAHLRSRSGTPTGRKTPFQDRSTPDLELSIQRSTSNRQRAHEGKSPVPSLNLSVFQRANSAGCARGVQSSNSGSSEDNSCMQLQTTEHVLMSRSQSNTAKLQIQEAKALNRGAAETVSRSQERPPSGRRSRSATPSGRKTPLDGKQIVFDLEQKVARPSSVSSRRESTYFKSEVTCGDVREEVQYPDGKLEQFLTNGNRIITFRNGTRKEVSADEQSVTITFFNGDVKQFMPDQKVIYYYADAKTTHTTYPNGMEMLQFPNNQIEKHYPDGKKEIVFPDQTVKHLFPDGHEQSIFPDGTIVNLQKNGDKIIEFSNGQREIHTSQYKRREYPDGTIKTVYSNGRQETKYTTGRVRIKDKEGNIIFDKK